MFTTVEKLCKNTTFFSHATFFLFLTLLKFTLLELKNNTLLPKHVVLFQQSNRMRFSVGGGEGEEVGGLGAGG